MTKPLGLPDYLKWLDKALRWGVDAVFVYGCHPRYIKIGDYDSYNSATTDAYVLSKDRAKAEYHFEYGYPACVDSVWKSREMLQNSQKCNKK